MRWSRRGLIAAALTAPAAAWAQEAAPPSEPAPDIVLALLSRQVTRMSIAVRVAGQAALFVIDTGAGRSAMAAELAARLGLKPGPSVLVHGVTEPEVLPSALTPVIEVGGQNFRDLTLPTAPLPQLGAEGLLGLDILGQFRLTIDNAAHMVTLASRVRGVVTGGSGFVTGSRLRRETTVAVRRRGDQLTLIGVSADDIPVEAFIDTGAQYSVGNPALLRSLAVDRAGTRGRRYDVPVMGVTGQRLIGEVAVIRALRIGAATLTELPAVFADLHAFRVLGLEDRPALLLGSDLIGAFNAVTLDFVGGEVRFGSLRRRPAQVVD